MTRTPSRLHSIGIATWMAVTLLMPTVGTDAEANSGARRNQMSERLTEGRRNAIVTAAQKVSPAVVTVSVTTTRIVRADPFGGRFRDEFFDRFFPSPTYRQKVPSMGSGVVVDSKGTVLTNSHVIRDADAIQVNLSDGRRFPARVLADSPVYDLAVLRIEGDRLPVARLGDSDSLVVGEWAIAIGNPFGFLLDDPQPTVTAGVVSATRRDIKSEATEGGVYKNMIQTDAAINPGNSGGPLVNGDGEVIGLNTFILTRSGGSVGLGFAIPINLIKRLLGELEDHGRIRQAWPGMQVQNVDERLAKRLGWAEQGGLVVTGVNVGGPAARAGLQVTDRICKVNGRLILSLDDAQTSIYGAQVGDVLRFEVERDGKRRDVSVTLEEAPRR